VIELPGVEPEPKKAAPVVPHAAVVGELVNALPAALPAMPKAPGEIVAALSQRLPGFKDRAAGR